MNSDLTEKVRFDIIRYANCWEDAEILLNGLNPTLGSRILSIGSAGDNSFSLLTVAPELVVAVDVNKIQLYLIELKKACIIHLSYEQLLSFLGFAHCEKREKTYKEIKRALSVECSNYWDKNLIQIKQGIISQGKFEKYFQLFSEKVLPWIHSRKTIEELLRAKSQDEQINFYDKKWNTFKWRLLFKIFFSRYVMGRYGRDPEFLKEVSGSVGTNIYKKAERHLKSNLAQNNFILRYNLTGNFSELLPHYLKKENYEKIKSNIHKLSIYEGYAEDACKEYGSFNYMNLSNIFEYMNKEQFHKTAQKLIEQITPDGRMAYWNLMVPRRISEIFPDNMKCLETLSLHLTEIDKGFFYDRFIIDQKI